MSKDILYLGSESKPRQRLLDFARISYKMLKHKSDEMVSTKGLAFEDYVLSVAQDKMQKIILPSLQGVAFVLTADTVAITQKSNEILKKPKDLDDARRMLLIVGSRPVEVFTACCLDKKIFDNGICRKISKDHFVVKTVVEFKIEQDEIGSYLQELPQALNVCGSAMIEDFGLNFLKSINGSYTSVLGLPLFEVRKALKRLGFRF